MIRREGLRSRLRRATDDIHQRMHGHPGFAAAASGRIDRASYRDLLARLYGFRAAFERDYPDAPAEMAAALNLPRRARATDIARDLEALGASNLADLPQCADLPARDTEPEWLGALYVVEGSTLGGAQIARALSDAGYVGDQRHYFEAYGEDRSAMWRQFLDRLERSGGETDEAERAAVRTFEAFEGWMRDWRGIPKAAESLG